ncbi:MAG: FHA domain-containing protein [Lentisphaeria bacterium]|jgi:pSer/pThr/pTyr-binding forkhead associated (FHA) protein
MIIRLELRGRILQEIQSADVKDELLIGRGQACAWVIPKEDTVASGKHAALFRKGDKLWIRDLGSTNGIYFQGKNIPQKRLEPGDRISIGDCILAVDEGAAAQGGREPSRLHLLNGPQKGQRRDLAPPRFTIGSDPASALVFLDMLVSKKHAEIAIKEDGSCWIRDLGSKNGTAVNGMPLRGDQERLLKDGDKIAVAHLEMVFLDGAIKHANSQIWLRFGILVATLLAALALYGFWQAMKPASGTLVRRARAAAGAADFATARDLLAAAANARRAARNEIERGDLLRNLSMWELTVQSWARARRNLEAGNWVEAARDLGSLQAGKKDVWTWSEAAIAERDAAMAAKQLLDAYTGAASALQRDTVDIEELRRHATAVAAALAARPTVPPTYLAKLLAELDASRGRLQELNQEYDRLELVLTALGQESPPFPEIIAGIEEVKRNAHGLLRKRADLALEPVTGLAKSHALLRQAAALLRDLQFQEVAKADLKLPSMESCAVNPRISKLRQELHLMGENLKATATRVSFLHADMLKQIGRTDRLPEQLECWRDDARMQKLFACDTLAMNLPKRSRTSPDGEFDRALGVEEFYQLLSALPEPADLDFQDLPFPSLLAQARTALAKTENFVAFLDAPAQKWLLDGRLGRAVRDAKAILAERDKLVARYLERAGKETGRRALIAGGIALQLAPAAVPPKIKDTDLKDWLAAELKKQRVRLLELNSEYGRVMPDRQIAIRNEILALGLPGDPVVRRMWAGRDAAKAAPATTP